MTDIRHLSTRKSRNFVDHYFSIADLPMNNFNTILISDKLNSPASPYTDANFSPKPNGSSYDISFRGEVGNTLYEDVDAIMAYMYQCLENIKPQLRKRN
jgi:hypothetical protein